MLIVVNHFEVTSIRDPHISRFSVPNLDRIVDGLIVGVIRLHIHFRVGPVIVDSVGLRPADVLSECLCAAVGDGPSSRQVRQRGHRCGDQGHGQKSDEHQDRHDSSFFHVNILCAAWFVRLREPAAIVMRWAESNARQRALRSVFYFLS